LPGAIRFARVGTTLCRLGASNSWNAAFFATVGLVMLSVAALLAIRQLTFIHRSSWTEATVIDHDIGRPGKHGLRPYCPIVSFVLPGETKPTEIRSGYCQAGAPEFRIGERVTLLYDPGDPRSIQFDGSAHPVWLLVAILGPTGIMFGAGAIAFHVKRRGRMNAQDGT